MINLSLLDRSEQKDMNANQEGSYVKTFKEPLYGQGGDI